MTLQQLTYFLAAAEHGSFTAAADVLRLARPSVSEQIAHLEAELGVALFVRAGRRLELTDAGRLLRPEAERTLAAAGEAADAVRRARTLTGGTASLGTFSTADHLLLPGLVEDFARRHPRGGHPRRRRELRASSPTPCAPGASKPGWSRCRSTTTGSRSAPRSREFEVVYASAEPDRLDGADDRSSSSPTPSLVLPEARWGDEDPTRRQLAERAQRAGVTIRPRIEVQHANAAARARRPRPRRHARHRARCSTRSATATGSPACRSTRRCTRRSPSSAGATPGSHRPRAR